MEINLVPLGMLVDDMTDERKIIITDDADIIEPTISSKDHSISTKAIKKGKQVKIKKRVLIKEGDLVFSKLHTQNGAFAYADKEYKATTTFLPLKINEIKTDKNFLFWVLHIQVPMMRTSDTVGRETYKTRDILAIQIPSLPLDKQKTIINKALKLREKIKAIEIAGRRDIDLIQKLRQTILQEAVSGKLVPQDPNDKPTSELLKKIRAEKEKLIKEKRIKRDKPLPPIIEEEIPYELPESWEWVRLGDIVSMLGDGIHGTPNYTVNGEYFFVNGNNLSDGIILIKPNTKRVSIEEYIKYKKELNERTVFVSINGTIGNVAFYNNEKIILGKSACYFNLLGDINKQYIKTLINTAYFLDYALGSATGTTIKNVSLKSMRLFPVPFPPLFEQMRIVEKTSQLMKLSDALEEKVKENQKNSESLIEAVLRESFKIK